MRAAARNYAREVHNIFVDDPHVRRLMVGETFNPPGQLEQLPAAQARRSRRRARASRRSTTIASIRRRVSGSRCSTRPTANA